MSFLKKIWLNLKAKQIEREQKKAQQKIKNIHQHDEKLIQSLSKKKIIPSFKQLSFASKYFSKTERLIARILSGIIIISIVSLGINIYWNNIGIPSNCYNGYYLICTEIDNNESYFYDSTKAPMNEWDFINTWQENANDYPTLK